MSTVEPANPIAALQMVRTMLTSGHDLCESLTLVAHPIRRYTHWSPLWDRIYDALPDTHSTLRKFCEKATGEDQFAVLDLAIATVEGEDAL
jgi:hypothetical protein